MQLSSSLAVSQNTRRVFHLPALIPEPSLSLSASSFHHLWAPLSPFLWNHFFFHVTFESLWCLLFCVSVIITAHTPFLIDVGNGRHKKPPLAVGRQARKRRYQTLVRFLKSHCRPQDSPVLSDSSLQWVWQRQWEAWHLITHRSFGDRQGD